MLILVIVLSLFAFPDISYADDALQDFQLTAVCSDNPSETRCWKITNPNNFDIEIALIEIRPNPVDLNYETVEANSSITICRPTDIGGSVITAFQIRFPGPEEPIYSTVATIDDKCSSEEPESEPEVWVQPVHVRTMPLTCNTVWINEDNNFEFIFFWEYKNNNWVKIYDMEDNLVWEIDFLHGEPRFEAELPDGMYTVRTFHDDYINPIQEFIIGKP